MACGIPNVSARCWIWRTLMKSSPSAPKLVAVEIEATSAAVPPSNDAVLVNDSLILEVPLTVRAP